MAVLAIVVASAHSAEAANFGAIAYSDTTSAYGYSFDYPTRRRAKRAALVSCRNHGTGCRVVLWFRNSCGALAIGNDLGWGAAWASSRWRAEREALRFCRQYSSGCKVAAYSCTAR